MLGPGVVGLVVVVSLFEVAGCSLDYNGFDVQPGAGSAGVQGGGTSIGGATTGGAGAGDVGGASSGGASAGAGGLDGGAGVGGTTTGGAGGAGAVGGTGVGGLATGGSGGTGGVGGSMGGAGGMGVAPQCTAQYGSTPEFELCSAEDAAACDFYVGNAQSCDTMCSALGGECVAVWDNSGTCGMGGLMSCATQGYVHLICSCSRGCGGGPACVSPQQCTAGNCQ